MPHKTCLSPSWGATFVALGELFAAANGVTLGLNDKRKVWPVRSAPQLHRHLPMFILC